jgi:hypothetical protein
VCFLLASCPLQHLAVAPQRQPCICHHCWRVSAARGGRGVQDTGHPAGEASTAQHSTAQRSAKQHCTAAHSSWLCRSWLQTCSTSSIWHGTPGQAGSCQSC